jgi:hypothetical protein
VDIGDIRAQLEEDQGWRIDEMRKLGNLLSDIASEEDRDVYRKLLVVMLYSHYEGFCKIALSIYAQALNNEELLCSEVEDLLVASSLSNAFKMLDSNDMKHPLFKRNAPDDSRIHRLYRRVEFIGSFSELLCRRVELPIDDVVNTQSNLTYIVLIKILYQLGIPYQTLKEREGGIGSLLSIRNAVAHGDRLKGITASRYQELRDLTFGIMKELSELIMSSLLNQVYRKNAS